MKTWRWQTAMLVTMVLGCALPAHAGDHLFNSTFEASAEGPFTDAQAARFLTQATFGPTLAEIDYLRGVGYYAWLDEQLNAQPSLHRPYLEAMDAAGLDVYQHHRQNDWWLHAVTAPDQLRQRVAFALSELLVVSQNNGALEGHPIPMAQYYDLLVTGAFGNYRQLLERVSLSPVMGHYLSMFKNQKPDPAENIRPDENYAREIMQLFSIGLVQLNPDGTRVLVGGETAPTYDQDTISGFAHVFTGWNYANCPRTDGGQPWEWKWCPSGTADWPEPGWDDWWFVPMEPWESYHASAGSKQLLVYPGVALADGILPGGGTAQGDLDAALDNIFQHPNVGPFIATHLIKRLVTSNPSPAYVGRVAAAFANNGLGVRGDLGATVTTVLMDPEARTLPSLPSHGGKLREPMLRLTHLWRALDGRADDGDFLLWSTFGHFAQAPLESPTVFNFFLPGYTPPGELTDLGLDAPEFQITTDAFIASTAHYLGARVFWYWRGDPNQDPEDVVVNLEPELAYAADPVRLVDRYDLLFMNRSMSDFMFNTLVDHLDNMPADDDGDLRNRVQDAVWLIQSSPEYSIER